MRFLALVTVAMLLTGCSALQPRAFPEEMGAAFTQIGTSLADQSVWQNVAARLGGEVIEPGVEGYAGVLYVAGGRITGAAGRLSLEGDGAGTDGLSPAARDVITKLAGQPELWEQIAAWLEANREPVTP